MPLIPAGDIRYFVESRGSGPPLMLLHGFTGSSASWWPLRDELDQHFRTFAIDVIGHGASCAPDDPNRYAFARVLDDLAEIARALALGPAIWLGYSMGGRVALGLALRHPEFVSALVMESATPGIRNDQERATRRAADEMLADQIEGHGIEAFVAGWEDLPMWDSQRQLPEPTLARQRAIRSNHSAVGLANSLRGMGQGAQPSYWDDLATLQMPVLVIAGGLDTKYARIAQEMHALLPNPTLAIATNAGHAVHLETPSFFVDRVIEFAASRPVASRS